MLRVNNLAGFGNHNAGAGSGYDADTQAFLTATGIIDPTISGAVDTLVLSLKSNSIWSKLFAIYPFVGASATAHKFNLKDPRDLDAAFRIDWNGSITHDNTGVTPDGSSGYGDSNFTPSVDVPANQGSMGIWVDAGTGHSYLDIGSSEGGATLNELVPHWVDNNFYASITGDQGFNSYLGGGQTLYQVVRTSSTNCFFQDTTTRYSYTASYSPPTIHNYIGAGNNSGTPSFFSARTFKFAYFGGSLTTTDADNLYTAVAAFQAALPSR